MRVILSFIYLIFILTLPILANFNTAHIYKDETISTKLEKTPTLAQSINFVVKPYVQNPTQTSMSIMWESWDNSNAEVMYGTSESSLSESVAVHSKDIVSTGQGTYLYTGRINGLEPNTKYWYGIKQGINISISSNYYFKTAPEKNGPFRMLVWGDNRSYPDRHRNVASDMAALNGDLAINAGDVVSTGSVYSQWKQQYFDPASDLLCKTPSLIAIGNHEYNDANFYRYVDHPKTDAAPKKENFFSLTYGPVFIIVLDNNKGWGTNTDPCTPGSAQYNWLVSQLESNEAMDAKWLIIVHHCPPYTNGWDSDGYAGDMDTRNYLVPLYEQYGVDMVIAGHTHDYERGILNGIHYIITGGGGSGLDHKVNDFEHIHIYNAIYHYIKMDISKNRLVYEVFDTLGNIIDDTLFVKGPDEILSDVKLSKTSLKAGDNATITWNTENTSGTAEIRLYSDNTNYSVINSIDITDKQFSWTVPDNLLGGQYTIKVKQDYLESTSDLFTVDSGKVSLINTNGNNYNFLIGNLNSNRLVLKLPNNSIAMIDFFNLSGKKIHSIRRQFNAGNNIISLPKEIFPSGVVIVKASYGNRIIKKQILLK